MHPSTVLYEYELDGPIASRRGKSSTECFSSLKLPVEQMVSSVRNFKLHTRKFDEPGLSAINLCSDLEYRTSICSTRPFGVSKHVNSHPNRIRLIYDYQNYPNFRRPTPLKSKSTHSAQAPEENSPSSSRWTIIKKIRQTKTQPLMQHPCFVPAQYRRSIDGGQSSV